MLVALYAGLHSFCCRFVGGKVLYPVCTSVSLVFAGWIRIHRGWMATCLAACIVKRVPSLEPAAGASEDDRTRFNGQLEGSLNTTAKSDRVSWSLD